MCSVESGRGHLVQSYTRMRMKNEEAAFLIVLNQLHAQHLVFMTVGSASYICICNMYGICVLDPSALMHKKKNFYHSFYFDFMHMRLCSRHFFVQ